MALEPELKIASTQGYCDPLEITINQQFKEMLPRPTDKEYEQIKKSIKEDGQEKSVVVNQEMVMVDGHTRLQICLELKKQVFYEKRFFAERSDVIKFMAIVNLHRRHLNQFQKVILYDELFLLEKEKAKQRGKDARKLMAVTIHNKYASKEPSAQGIGGESKWKKPDIVIKPARSREAYAKLIGVSPVVVEHAQFIKRHGGKLINRLVMDGKIPVREAYWKTKEKLQLKQPVENAKSYVFTIQPEEGSEWKCHRKLMSSQVGKIKMYIETIPVTKEGQHGKNKGKKFG